MTKRLLFLLMWVILFLLFSIFVSVFFGVPSISTMQGGLNLSGLILLFFGVSSTIIFFSIGGLARADSFGAVAELAASAVGRDLSRHLGSATREKLAG